jgi:NAD(P)-dependent dehydrogenase (short-subunit alcohol dehydrogenase family)
MAPRCAVCAASTRTSPSKVGGSRDDEAAALELASFGVRVNSLHPGLIQMPRSATEFESGKPDPGLEIPLRRVGQPEEVAELACLLRSMRAGTSWAPRSRTTAR